LSFSLQILLWRWGRTQGLTSAISAGTAAIVRVYAAFYNPNNSSETWSQTRRKQINIFANLVDHFPMKNGYVYWKGSQLPIFPKKGTKPYRDLLKKTFIGYHKDIQVTYGHRTPSDVEVVSSPHQLIDQVFGAAVSIGDGTDSGKYNKTVPDSEDRCQFALDQCYESAYVGALSEARQHLVLTLVGVGAFANKTEMIYSSILESHLRWTQNQKCTLEKVTIVVFRSGEVSDSFIKKLDENKVPFVSQWYKGDGTAENIGQK